VHSSRSRCGRSGSGWTGRCPDCGTRAARHDAGPRARDRLEKAIRILDTLVAAEVAIEVTHRSKRRLFALSGLVPIRDVVKPPYRPDPDRGCGRPRHEIEVDALERRRSHYRRSRRSNGEPSITPPSKGRCSPGCVVRNSRNALRTVAQGGHKAESADPEVAGQD
jgi:hypothetical protein